MRSIFLTDPAGLQLSTREKRLYILFAGFMLSMFLPGMPVVNNICFGLLFVYSFLFNSFGEKIWLLKQRLAVIGMILFFLIQAISILYSDNKNEGTAVLVLRLPMLMFPIALGTIRIGQLLKQRLMVLWIMAVLLAAIGSTIFSIIRVIHTGDIAWLYNDALTENSIGWQSSYFAILLTVTFFMFVHLLNAHVWPVSRTGTFLIALFLLVFHFLLASRVSIILLYGSILIYGIYGIVKKKNYKPGLSILGGLAVGAVLLVLVFPKTLNRFRELQYSHYEYSSRNAESHYNMEVKPDQWNGVNIRLAVWKCGWELVQENPVLGTGIGDKMDDLLQVYKKNGFTMAYDTKRNLHSTYLDVQVGTGLMGLLLFVLSWVILPLVYCFRNGDWLGAAIIGVLAFGCITESYPDRSQGNFMLAFLITFIISYRKQDQ